MLGAGLQSRVCATFRNAPQRPAENALEFRRLGPDFLYFAPQLKSRAEELVSEADVVHGHGLYVGTNYVFGQTARRQGKPLVYHVHGMFEPYILNRSRWKKRLVHWLFEDANFQHVRLWRALTQTEAQQIRACGIQAPVVVVPNGIGLEEFSKPRIQARSLQTPLAQNLEKRKSRLLFLGRLHPKKGLSLLLPAWARLPQFRKQWELVIAGPDELGHLNELRKMAQDLSLGSEVRFAGSVTGSVKSELLHSADLFVLPSYSEGFSMALLEAMACEIPVLATNACNFPDISLRQAGWECEASLSSLTETLSNALNADSLELLQRGRNGRALVEECYTWPRIIERLLEACEAYC
jgi:glycosyltransferase involved in cell wall biosynthesis